MHTHFSLDVRSRGTSQRHLKRAMFPATALVAVLLLSGPAASAHPPFSEHLSAAPSGVTLSAAPRSLLWVPPVGNRLTITGPYVAPPHPYAAGHRGIDLAAGPGFAVRAPAGGTISFRGKVVDREVISVRVDEHTVFSLEPVTSALHVGDIVRSGDHLGYATSGGHCLDECLHLGVRLDDSYVNPVRYFLGAPVLKPWGDR
jgi:murein DD-endopeptidase MepM/ murein hydrolase activator NlpD